MKTVSIFGIGRIGGGLAIALSDKGYRIENLISRGGKDFAKLFAKLGTKPNVLSFDELEKINSELVLICVPDGEISEIAGKLARKIIRQPVVLHTSGALSSEILTDLEKIGCSVGSIHPLISASDMFLAEKRFENAFFAVEGGERAVGSAQKIAADLGGKSFTVETKYKTLYHAAAVTACGHLVAVIDVALEMLLQCGLTEETGRKILLPLIKSTVENLETQNTSQALTGTFARADVETFQSHLRSIEENLPPEILEIYLQLGLRSLPLAEKQGANGERLETLRRELLLAKHRSNVKI